MKHYLITAYQEPGEPPPPEVLEPVLQRLRDLTEEMKQAGVWVFGGGMHDPSTATVVNHRDGELVTTDGPYLETKEYIGGFDIVRAADLDAALAWGAKVSRILDAPVEVRPFVVDI